MNELNKLISSVVLLGAGFFAASLVGPPEVIERLSHYLHPSGADAEGLRPLVAQAAPSDAGNWAALPPGLAPAPTAAPTAAPQVASVAAMTAPASWDDQASAAAPAASVSPWGGSEPAEFAPAPAAADWLTGASFGSAEPAQTAASEPRPLTPVPRGGVTAQPVVAAQPTEPAEWPELRAPLPPAAEETRQEVTAARPVLDGPSTFGAPVSLQAPAPQETPSTLQESPYGTRPRFDASATNADSTWNPLRPGSSNGQIFAPVERQPVEESYTKHIVTDGDTLPLLAERYLGDASRASELFELNRDRLEHPDVLPIGMILRAPDRPTTRQSAAAPARASGGGGYPRLERPGDFATVSATEAYVGPMDMAPRRPMTAVGAGSDRPLTRSEQLGPVDAVYNRDIAWDSNRW